MYYPFFFSIVGDSFFHRCIEQKGLMVLPKRTGGFDENHLSFFYIRLNVLATCLSKEMCTVMNDIGNKQVLIK